MLHTTTLAVALLASSLLLGARPQTPPLGPPPLEVVLQEHAAALGIDEDTLAAVTALAEGARTELDALHEQRRRARASFMTALEGGEAPSAALQGAARAEAALRLRELELARAIHGLLTPSQRAALRPPPPPRPPPPELLALEAAAAGVDALTARALADVFEHFRPTLEHRHAIVRRASEQLLATSEAGELAARRGTVHRAILRLHVVELELLFELRALLTDEQWRQLAPALRGPPPRRPPPADRR